MKKLASAFFIALVPTVAFAAPASDLIGAGMPPLQAEILSGEQSTDVIPKTDITYDLGSSAYRWVEAWFGSTNRTGSIKMDEANGVMSVGGETSTNLSFKAEGSNVVQVTTSGFLPWTDNGADIGSGSLEFKDAYGDGTLQWDAIKADVALELPNGTALPATCEVGYLFHDTDSDDCANTGSGDGALCICKSTNTWALISNF